jgi:hypothetical protein
MARQANPRKPRSCLKPTRSLTQANTRHLYACLASACNNLRLTACGCHQEREDTTATCCTATFEGHTAPATAAHTHTHTHTPTLPPPKPPTPRASTPAFLSSATTKCQDSTYGRGNGGRGTRSASSPARLQGLNPLGSLATACLALNPQRGLVLRQGHEWPTRSSGSSSSGSSSSSSGSGSCTLPPQGLHLTGGFATTGLGLNAHCMEGTAGFTTSKPGGGEHTQYDEGRGAWRTGGRVQGEAGAGAEENTASWAPSPTKHKRVTGEGGCASALAWFPEMTRTCSRISGRVVNPRASGEHKRVPVQLTVLHQLLAGGGKVGVCRHTRGFG